MLTKDYHKIALGNNNEGGLTAWHRLSPPLFRDYICINSAWTRRPARLTFDQVYRTLGKDSTTLTFTYWSPQEMDYFITTFFANDAEDVKVTVRTPVKDNQYWANFNADMQRPRFTNSMRDENDDFRDVQITFRNLTELP